MEFHVWGHLAGKFGKAEILNDDCIHACGGDFSELCFGRRQLVGENERIHRHEAFHAVAVKEFHELLQVRIDEIIRAQTCVEAG